MLKVLHFRFLQNLDRWRCFFEKNLDILGIKRKPVQHFSQLFLLSFLSTRIALDIDEDLFAFELKKQNKEVREYINENGLRILKSYSEAYENISKENLSYAEFFKIGQIVCQNLFQCTSWEHEKIIEECASALQCCYFENLDFFICAQKIASYPQGNFYKSISDKRVLKLFSKIKQSLRDFFEKKCASYIDQCAFDVELDMLSFFIVNEIAEEKDVSVLCKTNLLFCFDFVEEEVFPMYRVARSRRIFGHIIFTRLCLAPGHMFDLERFEKVTVSDSICESVESFIKSIYSRVYFFSHRRLLSNYKTLPNNQKVFFLISVFAQFIVLISFFDEFGKDFYIFLRCNIFVSFVWMFFKMSSILFKFLFILSAILYNPFSKIYFAEDEWTLLNILSVLFLFFSQFVFLNKVNNDGAA